MCVCVRARARARLSTQAKASQSLTAAQASFKRNAEASKTPHRPPPQLKSQLIRFVTSVGAPKWRQYATAEGRKYYYHVTTCMVQWNPPPGENLSLSRASARALSLSLFSPRGGHRTDLWQTGSVGCVPLSFMSVCVCARYLYLRALVQRCACM